MPASSVLRRNRSLVRSETAYRLTKHDRQLIRVNQPLLAQSAAPNVLNDEPRLVRREGPGHDVFVQDILRDVTGVRHENQSTSGQSSIGAYLLSVTSLTSLRRAAVRAGAGLISGECAA